MSKAQEQKETEKTIRTMIRMRFSVAADRAIHNELQRYQEAMAAGVEYTLDVDALLRGIGNQGEAIQGVIVDDVQSLPW